MSADNWAICPRCKARRRREADEAHARVLAQYGKIDFVDFDRLRERAAKAEEAATSSSDRYRTFREDYEITGAESGVVTVSYSGRCNTCSLAWTFGSEHPLPVSEA